MEGGGGCCSKMVGNGRMGERVKGEIILMIESV